MNKKFLSTIGAVTLLSVTLSSVSSCGLIVFNGNDNLASDTLNETGETTAALNESNTTSVHITEVPDPEAVIKERLSALPVRDMSEVSVIIAAADASPLFADSTDTPDTVSRQDSKRAVEEKYNTSVIEITTSPEELFEAAREAYNADMYYADLLAIPQSMLGQYFSAGILSNLRSLPYVNLDAPYYNQSVTSASVAGNGVYAVSGVASFNPAHLSCVYFNRGMVEQFVGEDLYALVNDGKWTWDKFAEFAKTVDSVDSIHGHGSTFELYDFIDVAASSQGIPYISNTEGVVPTVTYLATPASSNAKEIVSNLRSLLYSDGSFVKTKGSALRDIFTEDKLMFMTDGVYAAELMADSVADWGMLPLPKFDEAQKEYISPMLDESPVFCVLKNTPKYETSGLILEALNIASYEYVTESYINRHIDYILRDDGSIHMLELICNTAWTDFAHMYASGIQNLESATYGAIYKAVTTRYSIDSLYKNLKNTANRAIAAKIKVYS